MGLRLFILKLDYMYLYACGINFQDHVVPVSTGGTWKREEAEKHDTLSESLSVESLERKGGKKKRTLVLILLGFLLISVASIPVVFHLLHRGKLDVWHDSE